MFINQPKLIRSNPIKKVTKPKTQTDTIATKITPKIIVFLKYVQDGESHWTTRICFVGGFLSVCLFVLVSKRNPKT